MLSRADLFPVCKTSSPYNVQLSFWVSKLLLLDRFPYLIYMKCIPVNKLIDFLHITSSGGWSMRRLDRWWYSDCNSECNWSKIRIICSRCRFLNMFQHVWKSSWLSGLSSIHMFPDLFYFPGYLITVSWFHSIMHRFHLKFLLGGRYLVC